MLYSRWWNTIGCSCCASKTWQAYSQPWHVWTSFLWKASRSNPWAPVRVRISSSPWVRLGDVVLWRSSGGRSCCCCCFCSFFSCSWNPNICEFLLSIGFGDLLVPMGSPKVSVQVIVVRIGVRVEVVIAVVAVVMIMTSHTSRVVAGMEWVVRAVSAVVSKWAVVRVVGVVVAGEGIYIWRVRGIRVCMIVFLNNGYWH